MVCYYRSVSGCVRVVGVSHDRDVNAAMNILGEALRISQTG